MRRSRLLIAATLGLSGCSVAEDLDQTQKSIALFHRQLDRGEFAQIYDSSSGEMKGTTPRADMLKLLKGVHDKLGRFRGGKTGGWNDNRNAAGHFVTINYAAAYEKGPAQENFVYRIDGKRARLAGYHVTSNVFITG